MGTTIPPDIEQRIRAQIEEGHFATSADVLREAMDAIERRQSGLNRVRELVAEADADLAAGRVGSFDANETKRVVRDQLRRNGISD